MEEEENKQAKLIDEFKHELEEEKESYNRLIETLPYGWAEHLMIFDDEGRPFDYEFLEVNSAFEQFTGLTREAVVGKRVTEIIPGIREAKPDLIVIYGEVVTSGKEQRLELYFQPFDRWYGVTVFTRRPGHFVTTFEDITERKRTEEELRLKNIVFESSIAAMSTADSNGILNHVNQAFVDMWGYDSKESVIGNSLSSFFSMEEEAVAVLNALSSVGTWEGEFLAVKKNGDPFISHGLATTVLDETGKLIGYQSTSLDVTAEREAMKRLTDVLTELRRSNEELEQFAYVASHDLNEPLRMVISYLQLIEKRYKDILDEKGIVFMNYAVDGAKRMKTLISDLLNFSRISTQGKKFSPVNTEEVMQTVLLNLKESIQETDAKIEYDKLPGIFADDIQITQLFQNLISNSIKFRCDDIPHINISAKKDNGQWFFSVRDNGIGIDPKYADKIFVIFQRLHKKEEYSGTGIGLALCKKIVNRHNGRIWFESEPGNGTTFYFTIPEIKEGVLNGD